VSKGLKNISVFSLWLAGLVIMAHLFIAHDHHSECSVLDKKGACHAGKSELPVKSTSFPLHCHALNDLTFKNTSTTFLVSNDILCCDLFILSFFDTAISNAASADFIIKDFPIPLIKTDFLRLSPFRAPPALA
jgi:hypothetical protein